MTCLYDLSNPWDMKTIEKAYKVEKEEDGKMTITCERCGTKKHFIIIDKKHQDGYRITTAVYCPNCDRRPR